MNSLLRENRNRIERASAMLDDTRSQLTLARFDPIFTKDDQTKFDLIDRGLALAKQKLEDIMTSLK